MMLLLEVISHQQHLQQQHLYIYDAVVGVLGGNLPTQVETFPPGFKPFHPGENLPTRVKTFPPGWNLSHLYSIQQVLTIYIMYIDYLNITRNTTCIYNTYLLYAQSTYSI